MIQIALQLHDPVNNELFIPENTVTTSKPSSNEDESDLTDHAGFLYLFIQYSFLTLLLL